MAAVVVGYPFDTGAFVCSARADCFGLISDAVKVRFQNPQTASRYRSATHAFFTIVREERVRGLYRGIAAPLVRTRRRRCAVGYIVMGSLTWPVPTRRMLRPVLLL